MFGITHNDLWVQSAEWDSLVRKFQNIRQSAFCRSYHHARDGLQARLLELHGVRHLFYLWTRSERDGGPFALEDSQQEHTLDPPDVDALLDELRALAEAHGFGVSFVLLPVNGSRLALEVIGGAAQRRGIPVLGLDAEATRAFSPFAKLDMFLFHDPCHLTADASVWTAERILERLDALLAGSAAP